MSKLKNLFQKKASPEPELPEPSPPPVASISPAKSSAKGKGKGKSPTEQQGSPKVLYKGQGEQAAKHRNPDYINLGGVYVQRSLHQALKIYCIQHEKQMSDVVGELIKGFLSRNGVPMD
jgi:hypothetical protein